MSRAQMSKAVPLLSIWCTAVALTPKNDTGTKRLVADCGADYVNLAVLKTDTISAARTFVAEGLSHEGLLERIVSAVHEHQKADPDMEMLLAAGDLAQDSGWLEKLRGKLTLPVTAAASLAVPKLDQPRYASLVGALILADEHERKIQGLRQNQGAWTGLKEKARTFIGEYF